MSDIEKESKPDKSVSFYAHKITVHTIDLADACINTLMNKKEIVRLIKEIANLRDMIDKEKKELDLEYLSLAMRCDTLKVFINRILKRIGQIEEVDKISEEDKKKLEEIEKEVGEDKNYIG